MDVIPLMRPWFGAEEAAAVQDVLGLGLGGAGTEGRRFRGVGGRGARSGARASRPPPAPLRCIWRCTRSASGQATRSSCPRCRSSPPTNAPRYVGARPVFADVDLETQNLTPQTVGARSALRPAP